MHNIPDLGKEPELPQEIIDAALDGQLVLFVGAGASMLLGMPSWSDLAFKALEDLRSQGAIDFSELEQLKLLNPKQQLSIAKIIAGKEYDLGLQKHLVKTKESGIYDYLNKIGAVCVTTNYDTELKPIKRDDIDVSSTPATVKRIVLVTEFKVSHLKEPGTVIHLHGCKENPDHMIVTTEDYLKQYDYAEIKIFLTELFSKKTLLFIGYGLEESEILEHILRRAEIKNETEKRRFVLQGFFESQKTLYRRLGDYYRKSFGLHLIGFSRDHKNYNQLETVIKNWSEKIEVRPPALVDDIADMDRIL